MPSIETLSNLCLNTIASNFAFHAGKLDKKLPSDQIKNIVDQLPTPSTVPNYSEEEFARLTNILNTDYWRKLCVESFSISCPFLLHKDCARYYVERILPQRLAALKENQLPSFFQFVDAIQTKTFALKLSKLPSFEFPYERFACSFVNLTSLNMNSLRHDIDRLGTLSFTQITSDLLQGFKFLSSLSLQNNRLNDEDIVKTFQSLESSSSLTQLNLSHNNISCLGIKHICNTFIKSDKKGGSLLSGLDLSNNRINNEACCVLGEALKGNESLSSVYLTLNSFDDQAAANFFQSLQDNTTLTDLNLSSNSLGKATADALIRLIAEGNTKLQSLDLSLNRLSSVDIKAIRSIVDSNKNSSIKVIDVRMNSASGTPTDAQFIDNLS